MNFVNFPVEIRLQVYKELLVLSEPVKFKTTKDLSLPPLVLLTLTQEMQPRPGSTTG